MMPALLLKDLRLNRNIMILSLLIANAPYVAAALSPRSVGGGELGKVSLRDKISLGFPISLFSTALASAFIGASPNGTEKGERTDRLLEYLPVTRFQVVISKLIVAVGILLLTWLGPAVAFLIYESGSRDAGEPKNSLSTILCMTVAWSLLLFGTAWASSVFIDSSLVAALLALVIAVVVQLVVQRTVTVGSDFGLSVPRMLLADAVVAMIAVGGTIGVFVRPPKP